MSSIVSIQERYSVVSRHCWLGGPVAVWQKDLASCCDAGKVDLGTQPPPPPPVLAVAVAVAAAAAAVHDTPPCVEGQAWPVWRKSVVVRDACKTLRVCKTQHA